MFQMLAHCRSKRRKADNQNVSLKLFILDLNPTAAYINNMNILSRCFLGLEAFTDENTIKKWLHSHAK